MSDFREFCWAILKKCSGWYDPLIQYKAFVDFATNAPGYGQLQNDTVLQQINQGYYGPGGCKEQEEACYAAGNSDASNEICRTSVDFCVRYNLNVNRYHDTMTMLKKIFPDIPCNHSCKWTSRHIRSEAKFLNFFPFKFWALRRLPYPSRHPKEDRCRGTVR